MSRRWLSLTLLFFSACYRNNPINCVASPGSCSATEICDTTTERCIDPGTIACSSVDCPTGTICDQSTMLCAVDNSLNIISIEPKYIKSAGGQVVVIKGTGFTEDSTVLFDGVQGLAAYVSKNELRVTTPSRPPGTRCGLLPLRVTNPDGNKKTVDSFFSYYFEDTLFAASALSTTLIQGAERLALVDLTQDGKNDLLVTAPGTNATVILGGPSGFESGSPTFTAANATVAVADLRAGRNFVLTANRSNSNLFVYKVMSGPALSYAQVNNIGSVPLETLALVDLNADSELDAIGLYASGQIVTFIHEGAWANLQGINSYSPPSLPMSKAESLVAGLYYGNKPLIASINRSASEVDLAEFNPSTRTFSSVGTLKSSATILDIFDSDVNGDGKKDLVVFNGNGSARIFYNDNGFSISRIKDITFSVAISGATVGDVDCDGTPDLIGLTTATGSSGVLVSTARADDIRMFQRVDRASPRAIAVGDMDGDLVPELVVFSSTTMPLNRIGVPRQM